MKNKLMFILLIPLILNCSDKFEIDDSELLLNEGFIIPLAQASLESDDVFSVLLEDNSFIRTIGTNGKVLLSFQDTILKFGLNDFVKYNSSIDSAEVPFGFFNLQREYFVSFEIPVLSSMSKISRAELSYALKFRAKDFSEPMKIKINVSGINSSEGGKEVELIINGNQEVVYGFEHEVFEPDENNKLHLNIYAKPCRQTGVYDDYTGKIYTELSDITLHNVKGVFNDTVVDIDTGSFSFDLKQFEEFNTSDAKFSFLVNNNFLLAGNFNINMYGYSEDQNMKLIHPELVFSPNNGNYSDTIYFNDENSNLNDVLKSIPDSFNYFGNVALHQISTSEIELSEEDTVSIGYLLELPSSYEFTKEIESELLSITDSDFIQDLQKATLSFSTLNKFPLKAEMVMYLYDSEINFLDSVNFPAIKAAKTDNKNVVIADEVEYLEKELTESELKNLKSARNLILKMYLCTEGKEVLIRNDYSFDIKLALKARKK